MNTSRSIPLSDLLSLTQAGYSYEPRAINTQHVEHIVACNLEGFPPIDVVAKNQQFVILNGYHRVNAASVLGLPSIEAVVHSFSCQREVIDFAYRANLTNGLPLSRKEKEAYIVFLTIEYPELTQEAIARRVSVDQTTVGKTLRRLGFTNPSLSEEEKRYAYSNRDSGKKLYKALNAFFENEKASFRGKATPKSEEKRAMLLAQLASVDDVLVFESLARSLTHASSLIRKELE